MATVGCRSLSPTQHGGGPSGDKELTPPQWDGWVQTVRQGVSSEGKLEVVASPGSTPWPKTILLEDRPVAGAGTRHSSVGVTGLWLGGGGGGHCRSQVLLLALQPLTCMGADGRRWGGCHQPCSHTAEAGLSPARPTFHESASDGSLGPLQLLHQFLGYVS